MAIGALCLAGHAAAVEYWLCAKAGTATMPGGPVPIWGYTLDSSGFSGNCGGTVTLPGPALEVPAGDGTLTVHLRNELAGVPTSIVMPGQTTVMTPVWDDGGTGARTSLTQRVRSFTHEAPAGGGLADYTWNGLKPGSYLYHSGTHPQVQVQMGLYGAVLKNAVDAVPLTSPAEAYAGVPYDIGLTLLFSEIDPAQHAAIATGSYGTPLAPLTPCPDSSGTAMKMTSTLCYRPKYFLLNGKPFDSADPPLATLQGGQRVLMRFLNAGLQSYVPMVQGMHMRMVAEDGNRYVYRDGTGTQPRDQYQYSTLLPALKTVDAVIVPTQAGRFPIYDRRLNLVDANAQDGGMFAYLDAVASGDLSLTKTDGVASVTRGEPVTYSIVVSNTGPDAVSGATVTDTLPAGLTAATWTCSASAGSGCASSAGSGNINHKVNLAAGGSATFTLKATVGLAAPLGAGALVNTASVAVPAGVTDAVPGNNGATDSDTVVAAQADLALTKTDGLTSVVAGQPVSYTIVVSNLGPSSVTGAAVADTLPAALTGATWSCVASAGSGCAAPNGAGSIATTVSLVAGGSATFTVNATLSAAATGTLSNTATVTAPVAVPDLVPGNNSATDTSTITAAPTQANLGITKTNGVTGVSAGAAVTYTIVVSNAGPSAVTGATVTDTLPAALTGATWTCVATGTAACGAPNGVGNIGTTVNVAAGAGNFVTFTVNATISAAATGNLVNTATVATPGGVTDPTPANNSATDTDAIGPAQPALPTLPSLDTFTRADANTLGASWQQLVTSSASGARVNTNQGYCTGTLCPTTGGSNAGAHAFWNVGAALGSTQAAALTFANTTLNNVGLMLKAGGTFGNGRYQNSIRVRYTSATGGVVAVETTTNGNATTPTWTTRGQVPVTFANGDRLTALVNASRLVSIWKTSGATTTYVGQVQLPTGTGLAFASGGGRIGLRLMSGARVDNFSGGNVAP